MNVIKNEMSLKATYTKPALTVYGAFSELTAAGSGVRDEGAAMTAVRRRP